MHVTTLLSLLLAVLVSIVPGLGFLLEATQVDGPETIRRTLQWTGSADRQVFELSNIRGSVHIVAEDRRDVSVVAQRTVKRQGNPNDPGPSIDFRQDAERVLVCGDNRHCGCHIDGRNERSRDDDRTRVQVDFEVRVPKRVTLDVCAVNGGTVTVEGAEGPFTVRNVNGGLELSGMRGAGSATTVNGNVDATFAASPTGPTSFKTVNGRVDVTFPASLAADLRLKTMNGGLYTDFETTPLPTQATPERRGGRFVYRSNRFVAVRVGAGGPELTFETLNGNVQVRKR